MPQLTKDDAKAVGEAESASFEALPEGIYQASLAEVTVGEGQKGPYWIWRFENLINVESEQAYPGSQWLNTSLSENARWKLKEVFDGFGVEANTDTDELLGKEVWLTVSQRVIEKGARMGDIGNQVERVMGVGGGE